ncbi:MAG: hypothetical protein ABIH70_09485 [Chloroflexota bacterium]
MWRKKKWIIAIVLAVVVMLAGGIGSAVFAQTESTSDNSSNTLLVRVATILGIDQQQLEDAFAQAQKDMRAEALDNRLKSMVENGTITQEQADQYKQWWQAKPDVPGLDATGRMGVTRGFSGPRGFHKWRGQFGVPPTTAPSTTPSGT